MLASNQIVGNHYKIISPLGEGGMGMVYKALDLNLHREVALKFLQEDYVKSPELQKRFLLEGQVLATIKHRCVVEVHSSEIDDGTKLPFLVMELVDGQPLNALIATFGSRPQLLIRHFIDLLEGIHACHLKNVIHRDIKPANVLLSKEGTLKIVDFGIAKTAQKLTNIGISIGTPHYMSPEQCNGSALTPKADVYSLGILFWELLTGNPPFVVSGESSDPVLALISMHLFSAPPVEKLRTRENAAPFHDLLSRMLAKEPAGRPEIPEIIEILKGKLTDPAEGFPEHSPGAPPGEESLKPSRSTGNRSELSGPSGPGLSASAGEGSPIAGTSLSDFKSALIGDRTLLLSLMLQVSKGLNARHKKGIIHGDLRPQNIILQADGNWKIADFGAPRSGGDSGYMSPEQCAEKPEITAKSDIYSLGIVFWEMLFGEQPFKTQDGRSPSASISKQQIEATLPVKKIDPSDPRHPCLPLILKMLDKAPENRPTSIELVDSLAEIIGHADSEKKSGVADRGGNNDVRWENFLETREEKPSMGGKLFKGLELMFDMVRLGAKNTAEKAMPLAEAYLSSLFVSTIVVTFTPFLFFALGILTGKKWLISLTGIWWAFWMFVITVAAAPIGILIETLSHGLKDSGQRYVKSVSGVLLFGLCLSLFASIIPFNGNLAMLPMFVLAALILGLLNTWLFSPKVVGPLVTAIFFILLFSFCFPTTFETFQERIFVFDLSAGEPERVQVTREAMEKKEIKFFRPDGSPEIWYHDAPDGKIELFNRKGRHPTYGAELKPITADIVGKIEARLADAERGKLEEVRVERERKESEEQKKRAEESARETRKQEEAKNQDEKRQKQEHENFLNRYLLTRSFENKPGSKEVGICIVDDGKKVNQPINQKIAEGIRKDKLNVINSLFSPDFVADGLFEKVFQGGSNELKTLEVQKYSDFLILGKKEVSFAENPAMQNMITAKVSIEIHIISVETGAVEETFSVTETGAGFSKSAGEETALDRILPKFLEKASKFFS